MLEMKKSAVSFDENDLMALERIMTDADTVEGMKFLRKCVYDRIAQAQQGRLKSHLNGANSVEGFIKNSK